MAIFRPNLKLAVQMHTDPKYQAQLLAAGHEIRRHAEMLMPRGGDERRGHMADKFAVEDVAGEVRVGNTDESFYHLAEFGSAKNPPYAPLRRGARAAGLELHEAPQN